MSIARAAFLFVTFNFLIAGVADAGSLTIEWDPPTDGVTTGFIVWGGTSPGSYSSSIDVGMATSYTVANLPDGATFYFVVQSYNAEGDVSPMSEEVSGTTRPLASCGGAPGTPNLVAAVNGSVVDLSWSQGAGATPTEYHLDVGTAQGRRDIASMKFAAGTRTLATAAPAGTYWLRLTATNACGSNARPAVASVTVGGPNRATLPGRPTALTDHVEGHSVRLSWTAPVGSEVTRYLVDVHDTAGNLLATFDTGSAATSFSRTDVAVGAFVVYVRAANEARVGEPSNPIMVKVGP
jgi:predicted phage tail protein